MGVQYEGINVPDTTIVIDTSQDKAAAPSQADTPLAPAMIRPSKDFEAQSTEKKIPEDLQSVGPHNSPPNAHDHSKHLDGLNDVDNEQPYGWVVVAAAFFVQAMIVGQINGFGVYEDRYKTHEYSTSTTFELSWIGTLNVVGMNLIGPITGQVADYLGYRLSSFIGGIVMCLSLIAASFSTKVWHLYICQGILYGLGGSLAFFPSLSLPSQWFKRRRGLATGIAVAGGGFGGLVISPVTTVLFDKVGYRWTLRIIAFLHLAIVVPAALVFRARVESGRHRAKRLKREQLDREAKMTDQVQQEDEDRQSVLVSNDSQTTLAPKKKIIDFSMLKDKRFALLVILSFFVANGYFNPYYYFPAYVQKHGGTVSTGSLLIGILNGSSAVGRVTMGLASDYMGDVNTLFISTVLSSISVLVIWMLAGTSIPVMVVFCLIYGFFSGSYIAIVPTVAANLCGISRLASVTGIVYGGIAAGTLIGSPVGGALLDLSQGVDYKPMLFWTGFVMVVGSMLIMLLKLKLSRKLFARV
ncbi:hypothetical protein BGZ99_005151 [Dissophora globulifera]|uniref:Major facilitator superfamily (MFS) profile domain-containing protein n=1 Tax=Dissophora globulifera TaxID=979702 RepID=A0A9P6UU29_9FUNG|nr:hypothetical protein BGZ99_005151 [Dissophora globulifera]